MLDRTEQRIVGVLIEKERTVPDTYPLSENALVDGCNQKSNRDPVMDLVSFQVAGALMSLQEKGWVSRIDGGSRVTKYRHKVVERLGVTDAEMAVLAELLLRGAQAPGALKPRVQRMGFVGEADAVENVLRRLASKPQPLVEQLPLGPRERDRRWRHLLGPGSEHEGAGEVEGKPSLSEPGSPSSPAPSIARAPIAPPIAPPIASSVQPAPVRSREGSGDARDDLASRVAVLERQVAELQRQIAALGG